MASAGSPDMTTKALGKRQSRGWDVADDSSSVTSITSSARANLCHVCKEPEAAPTIKFVKCTRCKCSWHPYCHTPKILDSNVSTFTCARCKKKEAASITSSIPSSMLLPAHQSAEDSARRCEEPECTGIPSKHQATCKQLCKKHQIALDHQRSKMKPSVAMKTGSVPKLFSKGKLYSFKPEDKQYLKKDDKQGTKRKRVPPTQGGDSLSTHVWNSDSTHLHKAMADKPAQMQRSQPRAEFSHPFAPDHSTTRSMDYRSVSPEQLRSSLEPRASNDSMTDHLPMLIDNRGSMSPEYEPPSPKPLSRVDSPSVPTVSEATIQPGKASQTPANFESIFSPNRLTKLGAYQSPYATSEISAPPSVGQPEKHQMHDDVGMQDFEPPTINSRDDRTTTSSDQDPLQTLSALSIEPTKTQLRTTSSEATPPRDSLLDGYESGDELLPKYPAPWMSDPTKPGYDRETDPNFGYSTKYLPHPQSLEYKRRLRVLTFDPTELDKWLARSREPKPRFPPSVVDLYRTQKWGHIDPREAWPRRPDPEFLAAKRAEIEARPKRKANFGKVLTEQNIKERLEKGWNIHQNMESRSKEEKEALNRTYEVVYGIKGLVTDYEYKLIKGQEYLVEKAEIINEETGEVRRKKKSELRMLPIEG